MLRLRRPIVAFVCLLTLFIVNSAEALETTMTGELADAPRSAQTPSGSEGPIYSIDLGAMGLIGVGAAVWEADPTTPAANGATGFLWILDGWTDTLYRIDTVAPAIVLSVSLPGVDGICYDGRVLLAIDTFSNMLYQIDLQSGAILNMFVALYRWRHGACWGVSPYPGFDEYLWIADYLTGEVTQYVYMSPQVVSLLPGPASGTFLDGWRLWISSSTNDDYHAYDLATGSLLHTLNAGSVGTGFRDGTWDGHHLWDVVQQATGTFAHQWDLYDELGLYTFSVSGQPKHQARRAGDVVTIQVGIKNHASTTSTFKARVAIYNEVGLPVYSQGPVTASLGPGQVLNVPWSRAVPLSAVPGVFYFRCVLWDDNNNQLHEDWCVIEVQ